MPTREVQEVPVELEARQESLVKLARLANRVSMVSLVGVEVVEGLEVPTQEGWEDPEEEVHSLNRQRRPVLRFLLVARAAVVLLLAAVVVVEELEVPVFALVAELEEWEAVPLRILTKSNRKLCERYAP